MLSGGNIGRAGAGLFLFVLNFDGFKVFGLEDLVAVQTFDIVHAISAGNDLGTGMLTSGLHIQRLDEIYSTYAHEVVKPPFWHILRSPVRVAPTSRSTR